MTNALLDDLDDLDVLPYGWHLLHRVDPDEQIVVGPGGVFVLHTRHEPASSVRVHRGGVFVPGRRTDSLVNEMTTAERVSLLLSLTCGFAVDCEPVVLIASGELHVQSRPHDVHVLPADVLDRWLQHMPRRLSDETVTAILAHAQVHAAWRPTSG
jgi:hypothetical protein